MIVFKIGKVMILKKAQLVIADIPYQLGINAYGSSPSWYINGDNSNGESDKAHSSFFDTDSKAGFRIPEFFHFCNNLLIKEPKEKGKAPCMIIFCAFEQQFELIENAKKIWISKLYKFGFQKEFFCSGIKIKYACGWKL